MGGREEKVSYRIIRLAGVTHHFSLLSVSLKMSQNPPACDSSELCQPEPPSFHIILGNVKDVNVSKFTINHICYLALIKHNEHTISLLPLQEIFTLWQYFKSVLMNSHPSSLNVLKRPVLYFCHVKLFSCITLLVFLLLPVILIIYPCRYSCILTTLAVDGI